MDRVGRCPIVRTARSARSRRGSCGVRINNRRQNKIRESVHITSTFQHPTTQNGLSHLQSTTRLSKSYNRSTMFSLQTIRSSIPRRSIAATSSVRTYASQTPGNPTLEVFNRKTKHLQKDRAARNVEESRKVDYLKDEVAMRLCERLLVRSWTMEARHEDIHVE